jgi:probable HAF family extracellular repeat protein
VGIYDETTPFDFADGRGFLLDRDRFNRLDVPDAVNTVPHGINNQGQVVGEYTDADGTVQGFLWDEGRFTTVDGPDGTGASVTDINDRGQIIGVLPDDTTGATGLRGFLLSKGVYTTFDAPGVPIIHAFDINNRGQIVGTTLSDPALTEVHGFLLAKGVDGPFTRSTSPARPRPWLPASTIAGRSSVSTRTPDAAPYRQPSPMEMPMMMSGVSTAG